MKKKIFLDNELNYIHDLKNNTFVFQPNTHISSSMYCDSCCWAQALLVTLLVCKCNSLTSENSIDSRQRIHRIIEQIWHGELMIFYGGSGTQEIGYDTEKWCWTHIGRAEYSDYCQKSFCGIVQALLLVALF